MLSVKVNLSEDKRSVFYFVICIFNFSFIKVQKIVLGIIQVSESLIKLYILMKFTYKKNMN